MSEALVSIVIPSREGHIDALRKQLEQQTFKDWELVLKVGISPSSTARNLGAADARGKYLIFIDDDVALGYDTFLAEIVQALECRGEQCVIGVMRRLPKDASAFQRKYMQASFEDCYPQEGRGVIAASWTDFGTTCVAIPRLFFEQMGGYDDALASGDDYDLWYRVFKAGGSLFLATHTWLYHGPAKSWKEALRKRIWYEWGNAQVARKHPEANYRMRIKSKAHAAVYLLLRTLALPALMVIKISYHYRYPRFALRPMQALLSYVGAWVYCRSWFAPLGTGAQFGHKGSAMHSASNVSKNVSSAH